MKNLVTAPTDYYTIFNSHIHIYFYFRFKKISAPPEFLQILYPKPQFFLNCTQDQFLLICRFIYPWGSPWHMYCPQGRPRVFCSWIGIWKPAYGSRGFYYQRATTASIPGTSTAVAKSRRFETCSDNCSRKRANTNKCTPVPETGKICVCLTGR